MCTLCNEILWEPFMCVSSLILRFSKLMMLSRLPQCGHTFCATCIHSWCSDARSSSYTCPMCREVITQRPVEEYALKALVGVLIRARGDVEESRPMRGARCFEEFF